jgi:IS1 family transposase
VGWDVVFKRDYATLQAMLDRSPPAKQYYSDAFSVYETLVYYPGHWRAFADKSQTYSVEADHAELRHYLARLARKSRSFSRSIHALWRSVKLFVFAWNPANSINALSQSTLLMSVISFTLDPRHSPNLIRQHPHPRRLRTHQDVAAGG